MHDHEVVILQRGTRETRVIQRPGVLDHAGAAHQVDPVVEDRAARQTRHQRRFREHLTRGEKHQTEKRHDQPHSQAGMRARNPQLHRAPPRLNPQPCSRRQPQHRHETIDLPRTDRGQPEIAQDLNREPRGQRQREHRRDRQRAAVQRPQQNDSGQRHVSRKISTVGQNREEVIATRPDHDRERTGERDARDFPQCTRRNQRSWRSKKVTR